MRKSILTTVLAATLSLTSLPAPVQAGDAEDVARILGAAATLFIIGKAIEQSRDHKADKKKAEKKKDRPPQIVRQDPLPRVIGRPGGHDGYRDRPRLAPLPQQCLLRVSGADTKFVMGERCLSRNYASARPLPQACRTPVQTNRGVRPAYSVRCLRGQGYQVAGR